MNGEWVVYMLLFAVLLYGAHKAGQDKAEDSIKELETLKEKHIELEKNYSQLQKEYIELNESYSELREEKESIQKDVARLLLEYYGNEFIWDLTGAKKYKILVCGAKIYLSGKTRPPLNSLIGQIPC